MLLNQIVYQDQTYLNAIIILNCREKIAITMYWYHSVIHYKRLSSALSGSI